MSADGLPKAVRIARVASAFSPAGPVDSDRLFADRPDQVSKCLRALFQPNRHIALYGERGVGKSSLAIRLPKIVRNVNLPELDACQVNCNSGDSFSSIWRTVYRDLRIHDSEPAESPEDVRYVLQKLDRTLLIVLDELDRWEDDDGLSLLADTIKTLSDHRVPTTLMLVGVADTIDQLVGDHESIVRSLVQVHMPRMVDTELATIIKSGMANANLKITDEAKDRIILLSEGLPHYTHLLAEAAGVRAVENDDSVVTVHHLAGAMKEAVESPHSLRDAYHKGVQSAHTRHNFEKVLLACAFAQRDEFGYFRPASVRQPLSLLLDRATEIADYTRHLTQLTTEKRARTLERVGGERAYRYRFRNPLMQPYAQIRALATGLISEEQRQALVALRQPTRPPEPELPF